MERFLPDYFQARATTGQVEVFREFTVVTSTFDTFDPFHELVDDYDDPRSPVKVIIRNQDGLFWLIQREYFKDDDGNERDRLRCQILAPENVLAWQRRTRVEMLDPSTNEFLDQFAESQLADSIESEDGRYVEYWLKVLDARAVEFGDQGDAIDKFGPLDSSLNIAFSRAHGALMACGFGALAEKLESWFIEVFKSGRINVERIRVPISSADFKRCYAKDNTSLTGTALTVLTPQEPELAQTDIVTPTPDDYEIGHCAVVPCEWLDDASTQAMLIAHEPVIVLYRQTPVPEAKGAATPEDPEAAPPTDGGSKSTSVVRTKQDWQYILYLLATNFERLERHQILEFVRVCFTTPLSEPSTEAESLSKVLKRLELNVESDGYVNLICYIVREIGVSTWPEAVSATKYLTDKTPLKKKAHPRNEWVKLLF